jgi:hypothetical protein
MNQPTVVLPAGISRHTIVALTELAGERARQVTEEGFTPEWDDDHHRLSDLALAAAAYAAFSAMENENTREHRKASLWGFVPGFTGIIGQLWPNGSNRGTATASLPRPALLSSPSSSASSARRSARPIERRADDWQSSARSRSPAALAASAAEARLPPLAALARRLLGDGMNGKAAYVLCQGRTRHHCCHWPGCEAGAARHEGLPRALVPATKHLRDAIWSAYRPGQEKDMRLSEAYLEAARKVQGLDPGECLMGENTKIEWAA